MRELDMLIRKGYSVSDLEKLRAKVVKSHSKTREQDLEEIDKLIKDIPDNDLLKKDIDPEAIRKAKVASIVKELIGERSIRRTAEDSGVAASYITGILKERYLPSADILRRLSSPEAKPQNAITMEDLMIAAGYQTNYVEEAYKEALYEEITDDENGKPVDIRPDMNKIMQNINTANGQDSDEYIEYRRRHFRELDIMRERFGKVAKGLILQNLIEKQIQFTMSDEGTGMRGIRADIIVELTGQPVDSWWFDFRWVRTGDGRPMNGSFINARTILGNLIFVTPDPRRKYSIVISSKNDYDFIKGYADKLSFRGELSIILIDEENYSLVEETYLSHYDYKNEQDLTLYLDR